jgi:ketosteroid isomerase-like protein
MSQETVQVAQRCLDMVITVRGQKIIRSNHYLDHQEALEAVGLPE